MNRNAVCDYVAFDLFGPVGIPIIDAYRPGEIAEQVSRAGDGIPLVKNPVDVKRIEVFVYHDGQQVHTLTAYTTQSWSDVVLDGS